MTVTRVFCCLQAMGVPVKVIGFSDSKKLSQNWLRMHFCQKPPYPHKFTNNMTYVDGRGVCVAPDHRNCKVSSSRPVLTQGGLPCPAYSKIRWKGGDTPGTGATKHHQSVGTVFEFPLYLRVRKPSMFVIEESDAFDCEDGDDALVKDSPLRRFMLACSEEGYAVKAKKVDHSVFCPPRRVRWWIVGADDESGSNDAVEWICERVEEVLRHLEMLPQLHRDVWDVVDPEGAAEAELRKVCKEPYIML